jgi:hypothetical protein
MAPVTGGFNWAHHLRASFELTSNSLLRWSIGGRRPVRARVIRRRCSVPVSFAGYRFPPDLILLAVRWYLRYGLSYRDVEELLAERGIDVDHVTIYRWGNASPRWSSTRLGRAGTVSVIAGSSTTFSQKCSTTPPSSPTTGSSATTDDSRQDSGQCAVYEPTGPRVS